MKNLRHQLGFTQEELAVLLGVSRVVVTLYEKGLRNLPAKAHQKLSHIQVLIYKSSNHKYAPCQQLLALQQKHYQKAQNQLQGQAKKAAQQAIRVSMQLNKIRERLQQLEEKLALIQLLQRNTAPDSREQRLLQNMEQQLINALDTCNPACEYTTAYKLATLRSKQQTASEMSRNLERRGR